MQNICLVSNLIFFNLLFGVPFSDYSLLNHFQNPHNSFLMLHAEFGLLGLLIVGVVLIIWFMQKVKKKLWFECAIGIAIIMRACLDWMAFPGIADVFFWCAVIEVVKKKDQIYVS